MEKLLSKLKELNLGEVPLNSVMIEDSDKDDYHQFFWIVAVMLAGNSQRGHNHIFNDVIKNYEVNLQDSIVTIAWEWAKSLGAININEEAWVSYYKENPKLMVGESYDGITDWNNTSSKNKDNPRNILKSSHRNAVGLFKDLASKETPQLKDKNIKMILMTSIMILHTNVGFDYFIDLLKNSQLQDYEKNDYYSNIFYSLNHHTEFNLEHVRFRMRAYDEIGKPKALSLGHIIQLVNDLEVYGRRLMDRANKRDYDIPKLLNHYHSIVQDVNVWIKENFSEVLKTDNFESLLLTGNKVSKLLKEDNDLLISVEDTFKVNYPLFRMNVLRNRLGKESIDLNIFSHLLSEFGRVRGSLLKKCISTININELSGAGTTIPIYVSYPNEISFDKRERFVEEFIKLLEDIVINPEIILNNEIEHISDIGIHNIGDLIDRKKVKILGEKLLIDVLVDQKQSENKIILSKF